MCTGSAFAPVRLVVVLASDPAAAASDLVLFFLGSGFGLFVALLGWSDQIRGLTRNVRELERETHKRHPLTREDLKQLRNTNDANERLVILAQLFLDRKFSNPNTARLIPLFDKCETLLPRLDRLSEGKYRLTVALAVVLFLAGAAAAAMPSISSWLLLPPTLLVIAIFVLIIVGNARERQVHAVLTELLELL